MYFVTCKLRMREQLVSVSGKRGTLLSVGRRHVLYIYFHLEHNLLQPILELHTWPIRLPQEHRRLRLSLYHIQA